MLTYGVHRPTQPTTITSPEWDRVQTLPKETTQVSICHIIDSKTVKFNVKLQN